MSSITSYVNSDCLKIERMQDEMVHVLRSALKMEIDAFSEHMLLNVSLGLQRLASQVKIVAGLWQETLRKADEYNILLEDEEILTTEQPTTVEPTTDSMTSEASLYNMTVNGTGATEDLCTPYTCIADCHCREIPRINVTVEDRNAMAIYLKPHYEKVLHDLDIGAFSLLRPVAQAAENLKVTDYQHYTLQRKRIDGLLPYLRYHCKWCITDNLEPLFDIVANRLLTAIGPHDTGVKPSQICQQLFQNSDDGISFLCNLYQSVKSLDELDYMSNATFLDFDGSSSMAELSETILSLSNSIPEFLSAFKQTLMEDLESAASMTEELLNRQSPSCGIALQKLFYEYTGVHSRIEWFLQETQSYFLDHIATYNKYQQDYMAGPKSLTLEQLFHKTSFDQDITYIQGKHIGIETLIQDEMMSMNRTLRHIKKLYYWFMAQLSDHFLTEHSALWAHFGMTTADLSIPSSPSEAGIVPLNPHLEMIAPDVQKFLDKENRTIQLLNEDIAVVISNLTTSLYAAEKYLEDFVAGNIVSESFFKWVYYFLFSGTCVEYSHDTIGLLSTCMWLLHRIFLFTQEKFCLLGGVL